MENILLISKESILKDYHNDNQENSGMLIHFYKLLNILSQAEVLPESSIKWSVPADKRTRGKKQEPENTQSKINPSRSINVKPGQTSKDIKKQCHCMDCKSKSKRVLSYVYTINYYNC